MSRSVIILLTILSRLIPHPPNFGFMGGFSLWSGKNSNPYLGSLGVLALLFFTDLFLGFHNQIAGVYCGYLGVFLMGRLFSKVTQQGSFLKNTFIAGLSSLTFFTISNLWVWWTTYPHTVSDLVTCFVLAIPFLGYTFAGDFTSTHLFMTLPHRLRFLRPKPAQL